MASFDTRTWIIAVSYFGAITVVFIHPFHDYYGLLNRIAALAICLAGIGVLLIYNRITLGSFFKPLPQNKTDDFSKPDTSNSSDHT